MQTFGPARPVPLYGAEGSRALDGVAINQYAIPGLRLMERAGAEAFAAFRRRWPRPRRLAVICGPGNNGGDGYVVARLAAAAGWRVRCFTLAEPARSHGDAALALAAMQAAGLTAQPLSLFRPQEFDAVVDGLFGTGLARALRGDAAEAVARINAVSGPVLALDVPSGLDADTGATPGACVHACLTVCFIADKPGLHTGAAADHVGEICHAGLALPFEPLHRRAPDAWLLRYGDLQPLLGPRRPTAHKGSAGRAVIVGGEHGFAGAVRMAGEATACIGAGLTTVATRAAHVTGLLSARPELMARSVERGRDLAELLGAATVVGVGPGLGTGAWGRELLQAVLEAPCALVLDADALNLLSMDAGYGAGLHGGQRAAVLTPHPGEASRLLGVGVAEVERDRPAAARALSERLGVVVLLKGRGTVVVSPGQAPVICDGGHPAMASGGMGDVLTGVVCGLLAQGMPAPDAAVRGALIHARAAYRVAMARGLQRGLLAQQLMPELQRCGRWL
jgi:NAD(P)H-hydrate epimerase